MIRSAGVSTTRRRGMSLRAPARDESGASAVELVMYMPLLMITILFSVQFCLIYLGSQVASGAAREASRVARVTGDGGAASERAFRTINNIGDGVLDRPNVRVAVGAERARVTVSGEASKILPFLPIPRVTETVEGPIERFVPDGGAP